MQPPQAESWHPVQESSAKRVPGGTAPVGIASHTQKDCPGRMPWWDQPLRPLKNAWSDVWPFLLAPNGCTGEGACWEMLSGCHLQGKTADSSHVKYCTYPSPGASIHQLPVPGARERKREHPGGDWPLYPVCQGVHYSIVDGPDNGQGIVGQFNCPLQAVLKVN